MPIHRAVDRLDRELSGHLHRRESSPALDHVLVVPALAFGTYGMAATLGCVGLAFGWQTAGWTALACGLTVATTQALKAATARQRPERKSLAPRRYDLRVLLSNHAFPSGDTAQAAAVGFSLALRSGSAAWTLLPVAAAAGRVHFGAHWIGDTLAGAAVGAAWAMAVHNLAQSRAA